TEVSDYYDATTGLTWRHGGTAIDAESAASNCSGLTTSSYESFRLADIDELRTLVIGCYESGPDGDCSVSTSCYNNSCWSDYCTGCGDLGCVAPAALSSSCGRTWSSTSADSGVWNIDFHSGAIGWSSPGEFMQVLCVQGSPLPPTCTPTSFSTSILAYPSSTESTGYQVCSGQMLNFSASGTWCSSDVDCSGPEGISGRPYPEEQPVTLSGANLGALVGKVGDSYFAIGFGGLVYAPASGTLELLMNDRIGYYGDNTGSLTVYVDAY
ncbi:MAG TPA: LecA/PA-IL family lectin, partial [Polyangiaceae bacterium]|nr:LecA/PA-IL family lectin [Polyangiaceae bacterium]